MGCQRVRVRIVFCMSSPEHHPDRATTCRQIGLGREVSLDTITVPTEVILWRSTPAGMRTTCLDVYAGGDLTFFKVERTDGSALPYIDVLACGNGQFGGLGNAQFSNAQGTPVRLRAVSGLLECGCPSSVSSASAFDQTLTQATRICR